MEKYLITDNKTESRFETVQENQIAFLNYKITSEGFALLHTEVPPEIGGRGIAQALAKYAFETAESMAMQVLIYCPFITTYVQRHPELKSKVRKI